MTFTGTEPAGATVEQLPGVVQETRRHNELVLSLVHEIAAAQRVMLDELAAQRADLERLRGRRPPEARGESQALRAQSKQAALQAAKIRRRSEQLTGDASILLHGTRAMDQY